MGGDASISATDPTATVASKKYRQRACGNPASAVLKLPSSGACPRSLYRAACCSNRIWAALAQPCITWK
jgi:hypothetical protein